MAKKWIFRSTPPITASASPKSACACPGSCRSGTNRGASRISADFYGSALHAILSPCDWNLKDGPGDQRSCLGRIRQVKWRHGAVDEIDAVGNDMATLKRPDMDQILVRDDHAAGAQLGDGALHLQGVPQYRGSN